MFDDPEADRAAARSGPSSNCAFFGGAMVVRTVSVSKLNIYSGTNEKWEWRSFPWVAPGGTCVGPSRSLRFTHGGRRDSFACVLICRFSCRYQDLGPKIICVVLFGIAH